MMKFEHKICLNKNLNFDAPLQLFIMSASQKLGQKLLQGWTMLGETCSICSVTFKVYHGFL